MSTPFEWARQAGIRMTGGFAVVAECVTLDELERFAQIAISQAISNTPPQSSMAWQEGYAAGKSYEWVGLTPTDFDGLRSRVDPQTCNDFVFADIVAMTQAKLKEKND